MSFPAHLDAAEARTGRTPAELVALAHERGFDRDTEAAPTPAGLKEEFDLRRGHGMAVVHVIKNGATISNRTSARTAPTGTSP